MELRTWHALVLISGMLLLLAKEASGLKCFTCSSLLDDKCGTTWGYVGAQAKNYVEECVGDTVLCRKLEYETFANGEKIVTRSCWNTTSLWLPPETECNDMNRGRVCYCASVDEPCNGAQLLPAKSFLIVGITSLLFAAFIAR